MAFPRLPKRERRPRSLGFVIKVIFASAQNEERAWRMLSAPSEEGGQLTSALRDKAMQSVLKPEQVRVVYRRGTIEVLVVLEGLRIGYELLSEYKDFTESAELLLHDLEGTVQQYLTVAGFGPVVSSGAIIGLPQQTSRHKSLAHHALTFLLVTQIGIFVIAGLAVWKSQPIHDGVTRYQWYEFIPMTHQYVISRAVWGIAILSVVTVLLLIFAVLFPEGD